MKQKLLLTCLTSCILGYSAFAQKPGKGQQISEEEEDVYKYQVKENAPFEAANASMMLNIGVDVSYGNQSFIGSVEGVYRHHDKFQIMGSYGEGLASVYDPNSSEYKAKEEHAENRKFEITGAYFVYSSIKVRSDYPVVLDVEQRSDTTFKKYTTTDVKKGKLLGLRAGFLSESLFLKDPGGDNTENNKELVAKNISTQTETKIPLHDNLMGYKAITVGLEYNLITNIVVQAEGLRERSTKDLIHGFIDVIVAPDISFGNVLIHDENLDEYEEHSITDEGLRNIGVRLGASYRELYPFAYSTGGSVGLRPGLSFARSWYIQATFGASLSTIL